MKTVVVIDAQGGGIGKQVIAEIRRRALPVEVTAVGANLAATQAMLKAGADHGVTGENPVLVGCRSADVIIGPIGIVIADAMYGEITPAMAKAVGQAQAEKILIPVSHCSNYIAGVSGIGLKALIGEAVDRLEPLCGN